MNFFLKQFLLLVPIVGTLTIFQITLSGCGAKKTSLLPVYNEQSDETDNNKNSNSDDIVFVETSEPKILSSPKKKNNFPLKFKKFKVTKIQKNANDSNENKHLKIEVDIVDAKGEEKTVKLEGDLNKYNEATLAPVESKSSLKAFARCTDDGCVVDYFAKDSNKVVKVQYEHELEEKNSKTDTNNKTNANSKQDSTKKSNGDSDQNNNLETSKNQPTIHDDIEPDIPTEENKELNPPVISSDFFNDLEDSKTGIAAPVDSTQSDSKVTPEAPSQSQKEIPLEDQNPNIEQQQAVIENPKPEVQQEKEKPKLLTLVPLVDFTKVIAPKKLEVLKVDPLNLKPIHPKPKQTPVEKPKDEPKKDSQAKPTPTPKAETKPPVVKAESQKKKPILDTPKPFDTNFKRVEAPVLKLTDIKELHPEKIIPKKVEQNKKEEKDDADDTPAFIDPKVHSAKESSYFPYNLGNNYLGQAIGHWGGKITDPDTGKVKIYTGSLENGTPLPDEGIGFRSLHAGDSDQFYGSGLMIKYIEVASEKFASLFPKDVVTVNDIALKHGGKFEPHASHQNGLDGDFAYFQLNGGKPFSVDYQSDALVNKYFDFQKNWTLIKLFYKLKLAQHFFVSEPVKKAFCDYAKWIEKTCNNGEFSQNKEIFRRMMIEPGHGNHFHLRLKCTAHNEHCRDKDSLYPSDQCSKLGSSSTRFSNSSSENASKQCKSNL